MVEFYWVRNGMRSPSLNYTCNIGLNTIFTRMEKLTLSIRSAEKINWVKSFAKTNNTNVSRLLEEYIDSLMLFDAKEVTLSHEISSLRQPGMRPTKSQMARHADKRRKRSTLAKK